MRPLRFIALSEDGKSLVLAPDVPESIDNGERFVLSLDDRLRAAVRGDLSRLGQIEIELESQLRPREIQARIRAGETPDSVAAAAGIRIERVMAYAHPVLQERAQVAARAQQARVKIDDTSAAAPTLVELIRERQLVAGADDEIDWDARRLEDGQWEVSSTWRSGERTVTAYWRYDLSNGIVHPGNKDTVALIEPQPRLAAVPTPVDDPSLDEEQTGPIPLVRDDEPERRTPARQEPARQDGGRPRRKRPVDRDGGLEQLFLTDELDDAADPGRLGNADRRPELHEDDDEAPSDGEQSAVDLDDVIDGDDDDDEPRRGGDRKPRIPSWDDIVFGVKRRK